ncbi:hypothetical protein AXG93_702s1040 [Marchantia polymorpha subsp. ruderalis]|uniref:Malic enzyme n=1 Tax=Marchantia polymorpha subsp. ruderalis TaxID=1480154 RepID=A0A176WAD9_MARPO|nr:hypothetical protein AXG93_702s1040 [Marchantia polymorpha subsp. ruderalis]
MGMAALLTHCRQITDDVFLQAAKILAGLTPAKHLETGMLFPTIGEMKGLVVTLISGIAEFMVESKLGRKPAAAADWPDYIRSQMYQPGVAPTTVVEAHHADTRELLTIRHMYTDIQRYLFLRHLQDAKPDTFWKLIINNAQELLPYVYTPTVGEACQDYSKLPIETRGLYIRQEDSGKILKKLQAWRHQEVKVIVVTDGERILGLGDLGSGGMGISEGKIILYTVFGGLNPKHCLPVCIDVGTNNDSLIQDPQYKGIVQKRLRGEPYDKLIHEFVLALQKWQPHVLLQFEDFGNTNAFRLLEKYQKVLCCFNDDIQGTACIALTGIFSALRITGKKLEDQKILILGAGEAGTGIGKIIALALTQTCNKPMKDALKCCHLVDSKGLVCKSRTDLQQHKLPFAHDVAFQPDLLSAVKSVRPTILIGVSTITGAFNKDVLEAMRSFNARPVIFPLSNPTSKAECTFEEAYNHTGGTAVFASGKHVFGPIGMATVLTKCKTITEELFLMTAELLAGITPEARLSSGMLFPAFSDMKEVAPHLIAGICEHIVKSGQGTQPADATDWLDYVKSHMYKPPDDDE